MDRLWFPDGQRRLGRSASNQLIVIRPPPPPPPERGIFALPDELLLHILSMATAESFGGRGRGHQRPMNKFRRFLDPSVVCRRFNRLVCPLLYADMDLDMGLDRGRRHITTLWPLALRNLHRTFVENPSLRRHVRIVTISLNLHDDAILPALPLLVDLASFFTSARLLTFTFPYKNWEDAISIFRSAASHMAKLDEVRLSGGEWGPSLAHVCEALTGVPHLRNLTCYYLRCGGPQEEAPAKASHGTVSSIDINMFSGPADHLRRFLAWPTCLYHFTLGNHFVYEPQPPLSLAMIGAAISPQASTLRTLSIGYLEIEGLRGFDLTGFESLEELTLSAWTTGSDAGDEEKLLAPRLRKFTWDFPIEECRGMGPLHELGESEGQWLQRFAGAAIRTHSPLSLIYVAFFAVDHCSCRPGSLPEVYPWDHIDGVADRVRRAGIEVKYPRPMFTRDEFYKCRDGRGDES